MPQLDFYLNKKERVDIIQYCFNNGFKIVPDLNYETFEYREITSIESYSKYCSESPLLFLINDKYSIFSLQLASFEKKEQRFFFIKQRHGGPTIDFFSPVIGEVTDKIVGPGFVGIYSFYFNGKEKFFPKPEFVKLYNLITSYIKTLAKPIHFKNRTYYIGYDTLKRVKDKDLEIVTIPKTDLFNLI